MAFRPPSADLTTDPDGAPLAMAEAFAEIGLRLAAHTETKAALQTLVELAVEIVPGARWVSITRGRDDRFMTMASSDRVATDADLLQYRLGTGPCVDAVIDESVFMSNDLALDGRWSHFGPQAARAHGTRSVLSMRMTFDDDDLNAGLNMYGDHVDAFDDSSRAIATLLITHASVAVTAVVHREQAHHLRRAVDSNRDIGVAMGVLMARHRLTRDQAFDLLRIASQNQNRKLHDIARDVGDTGMLRLPR